MCRPRRRGDTTANALGLALLSKPWPYWMTRFTQRGLKRRQRLRQAPTWADLSGFQRVQRYAVGVICGPNETRRDVTRDITSAQSRCSEGANTA